MKVLSKYEVIKKLSISGKIKPVRVVGLLKYKTRLAYLIKTNTTEQWLPKSMCSKVTRAAIGAPFTCELPYDIARKKQMI